MKTAIIVGDTPRLAIQVLLGVYSRFGEKSVFIGGRRCRAVSRSTLCSRYFDVELDGTEDDKLIRVVHHLDITLKDPILVPADCYGERIVGRLQGEMRANVIPIPTLAQIDLFDNKWRFYQFCQENGFPTPRTILHQSKYDVDYAQTVSDLGLPFVVKPVNGAGSEGVHIVYDRAYYEQAILQNDAYAYAPVIAQKFIPGADGGLSILAVDGKAYAYAVQKYVKNGIDFIPNFYLEQAALEFCEASSYHGPVNLDVRIERDTSAIYFTEANPRFWGSTSAAVWCGLNFVGESMENPRPTGNPLTLLRALSQP